MPEICLIDSLTITTPEPPATATGPPPAPPPVFASPAVFPAPDPVPPLPPPPLPPAPAPVEGPKPEAEEVTTQEEVPGKASTTPKPEYKDTGYMQKDIAGGINKPKKMYRKEYPGDNPMAVETEDKTNSIKEELQKAYEDFKKKD